MYILTLTQNGQTFYLRGTVWAFCEDRAFSFDTPELAYAALEKAKPFMKKAQIKNVVLIKL